MQDVKIWRDGSYSIQKWQGKTFFFDKKWHVKQSLNHVNPTAPGKREMNFPLSKNSRLTFISRSMRLYSEAEHDVSTQILTYNSNFSTDDPYKDFNRYITNLKKNYGLTRYVAALEMTLDYTPHFHLMVDLPFTKAKKINKAWSKARGDGNYEPQNAVRDVRKVVSQVAAMHYCASYFSKQSSKKHGYRKFTYSRNLVGEDNTRIPLTEMKRFKTFSEKEHQYCYTGKLELTQELKNLFEYEDERPYIEKFM